MDTKIKQILEELYAIDGSLRERENELIKVIEGYALVKNEISADPEFKNKLLNHIKSLYLASEKSMSLNGFSIMNKISYGLGGALLVVALVVGYNYVGQSPINFGSGIKISQVSENAFGSLADVQTAQSEGGRGGGLSAASSFMPPQTAALRPESGGGMGGDPSIDSKLIWPGGYTHYKYVYKGQPVDITDDKVNVLQRVTGSAIANQLGNIAGRLNFDFINLKSFRNLTVQNISLAEERDFGHIVNISTYDGSVSIHENWLKWTNAYPVCNDETCSNVNRLKPSDVPADSELISIADSFIKEHGIDTSDYGPAQVSPGFYGPRPLAEAQTQIYVPDVSMVVYPLIIDGKKVYDGSQPSGIYVAINIRVKRVSSVNGIFVNRYESSAYETEKDFNRILKIAENGGYWGIYTDPLASLPEGAKIVEVEIGQPTYEFVKTYKHDSSTGIARELIVPALVFPVINPPQDGFFYQPYIAVPIVKDLIDVHNPIVMPAVRG